MTSLKTAGKFKRFKMTFYEIFESFYYSFLEAGDVRNAEIAKKMISNLTIEQAEIFFQ